MDVIVIAGAGLLAIAAAFVAAIVEIRSRRRRRASAVAEAALRADLSALSARTATLAAGEREAAWASRTLAGALERRSAELAAIRAALAALQADSVAREGELDGVRDDLRATTADLEAARRDLAAATDRIATLETELDGRNAAGLAERIAALETELADTRAAVATHAAQARDLRHRLAATEHQFDGSLAVAQPGPAIAPAEASRESELLGRIAELERSLAAMPEPVVDEDTVRRLAATEAELALVRTSIARSASAEAGLRDEVAALRAEAMELRARSAAAEADAARLRHESAAAREELALLRTAGEAARREADLRLAGAAARIAEMETAARTGTRDAAVVVAKDARIADLEQRLAAITAARAAEVRTLNDKIVSMERLYVDVEVRDRRIEALEEELKDTGESRDAALSELVRLERQGVELRAAAAQASASLERLGGIERDLLGARARIEELEAEVAGTALGEEVARLRASLAAERDRADRAVQRAALAEPEDATYAAFDRRLRERVAAAVDSATESLRSRIEHLQAVVVEKERRLASLGVSPAAPSPGPDDLTRIRGIGPKIAAILRDLGITTFRDIAGFSDDDVERVGAALPVYGRRIIDDDWIGQAQTLIR